MVKIVINNVMRTRLQRSALGLAMWGGVMVAFVAITVSFSDAQIPASCNSFVKTYIDGKDKSTAPFSVATNGPNQEVTYSVGRLTLSESPPPLPGATLSGAGDVYWSYGGNLVHPGTASPPPFKKDITNPYSVSISSGYNTTTRSYSLTFSFYGKGYRFSGTVQGCVGNNVVYATFSDKNIAVAVLSLGTLTYTPPPR